jgi:hypothetical protein
MCFQLLRLPKFICPQTNSPDDGYVALSQNLDDSSAIDHDHVSRTDEPLLPRQPRLRGSITLHPDRDTYSYSYGPKGLSGLWHNYYALLCAFFASIGGLTFGYDQGVVRLQLSTLLNYAINRAW